MKIKESELFKKQKKKIVLYIAQDKKTAAIKFAKELQIEINKLPDFPYKFKPSIYFETKEYREMTFRGFSIIYKVDDSKEQIDLLELFNRNLPILDESEYENGLLR